MKTHGDASHRSPSRLARLGRALAFIAPQALFAGVFFVIELLRHVVPVLAALTDSADGGAPSSTPSSASPLPAGGDSGGIGRALGHAGPLAVVIVPLLALAALMGLVGLALRVVGYLLFAVLVCLFAALVGTLQGVMVGGLYDAFTLRGRSDLDRGLAFKRVIGRAMLAPAVLVPYIALCNRGRGLSSALFAGWITATWSVALVLPVALAVAWWRTRRLAA